VSGPLPTTAMLRRILIVAAILAVADCSSTTAPPVGSIVVTVRADTNAILPGQTVRVTVSVMPPDTESVDYVKIVTSGLVVSAESLNVGLEGTFTVVRQYTPPVAAGTGMIDVRATASVGGSLGNGETQIAVADTTPPSISQFTATPPDSVQPGDSVTVNLIASDNVALAYSIVHFTGAVTKTDSVDEAFKPYAQHVFGIRVPSTAPNGTLSITAQVADVSGHLATSAVTPIHVADTRAPVVLATTENSRGTAGFEPGDTLTLTVVARDNARLAFAGYALGAPASVHDSFPTTDSLFQKTVTMVVPQSWTGTSSVTVFAGDAAGNYRQENLGTITVDTRTRQAPWSAPLDASVDDIAFDTKRDALYLSEPDSNRIAVLSLGSQTFAAPIAYAGSPRGIDLSLGGDSLLVALRTTPYVGILNLNTGARDTVRVVTDNFLDPGPDNLRVMGNDKALVTLTFSGSGYGGTVLTLDLATRAVANRLTVTELVPICRSGDRSTALILVDDSCCPIEGIVYDALSDQFPTDKGTVNQYFNFTSADFAGDHFLVSGSMGSTVFSSTLTSLGSPNVSGAIGASVLAPDGASAYFATSSGVVHVRLSDGTILDSTTLGEAPYRLAISPDGITLFAAAPNNVYVVDEW